MGTQLIEHDSDVAWLPSSTDFFVSAERRRLTGRVDLRSLKYKLGALPTTNAMRSSDNDGEGAGRWLVLWRGRLVQRGRPKSQEHVP